MYSFLSILTIIYRLLFIIINISKQGKPINMECEICGKPVSETNPTRAKIEGSVVVVCKECAKLGTIQKAPPKPRFQQNKKGKRKKRRHNRIGP